jgi:hypothetical protein
MPRFHDPSAGATEASKPLSSDDEIEAGTALQPGPGLTSESRTPWLFDPAGMGVDMTGDLPDGYVAWWQPLKSRPFDRECQPKPMKRVFKTQAEAEAHIQKITAQYGGRVITWVMPNYLTTAAREKRLKSRQLSLPCPLPLQKRPR